MNIRHNCDCYDGVAILATRISCGVVWELCISGLRYYYCNNKFYIGNSSSSPLWSHNHYEQLLKPFCTVTELTSKKHPLLSGDDQDSRTCINLRSFFNMKCDICSICRHVLWCNQVRSGTLAVRIAVVKVQSFNFGSIWILLLDSYSFWKSSFKIYFCNLVKIVLSDHILVWLPLI